MAISGISFPLSMTQAEFLVSHVDCVRPITTNSLEISTMNSMLHRGLIRYSESFTSRPKGTVLTDKGREIVCAVLGHYADQLVRARLLAEKPQFIPKNYRELAEAKIKAAMAEL